MMKNQKGDSQLQRDLLLQWVLKKLYTNRLHLLKDNFGFC